MKITANRADDIRKAREEYDAETRKLQEQSEANTAKWREESYKLQKALEQKVADMIGPTSLSLRIKADPWDFFRSKSWTINVNANEGGNFEDNIALVWNWEVKLDKDGNVVKDSGSWSGLKATTPEQIADLEESVRVIKILNNTDWKEILNSPMADWEDYNDPELAENIKNRKNSRPKFEDDLVAAELEDIINDGKTAIKLKQDQYYRGPVWILPTGVTDKFIKGYIFPDFYANKYTANEIKNEMGDARRSARSNIITDSYGLVTMKLD